MALRILTTQILDHADRLAVHMLATLARFLDDAPDRILTVETVVLVMLATLAVPVAESVIETVIPPYGTGILETIGLPVGALLASLTIRGLILGLVPILERIAGTLTASLTLAAFAFLRQRLDVLPQRGELPAFNPLRTVANQFQHFRRLAGDGNGLDLDACLAQHELGLTALLGQHERDHITLMTGTRGTTGTMQERLRILRRLNLHHELHATHVDATCGHVGGGEHVDFAAFECGEITIALVLVEVAVQLRAWDTLIGEAFGELLRLELGAGEQDALARAGSQGAHDLRLVALGDLEHVVRHLVDRTGRVVDAVHLGIMQETVHDLVDTMVERRGEQHVLGILRGLFKQTLHAGQEAHIGHFVCLIEHHAFNGIQGERVLAQQILQTPGASHHDLGTGLELGDLTGVFHAAIHGGGAHAVSLGKRQQHVVDLFGEFTGGREHQRTRMWHTRVFRLAFAAATFGFALDGGDVALARGKTRDQGNGEGERLAGPRAATAENVTAGQGIGQGVGLDGERGALAVAR